MTDEYDYNEEDLKQSSGGGGEGAPIPIGEYDFNIEKAEVKKSKKGQLFLRLQLRIPKGRPQGNRVVFEGYLPLSKAAPGNKRASSFFKAVGVNKGRPPGAPKPGETTPTSVSHLVGQVVTNKISHEYDTGEENDEGYAIRVASWTTEGKALLEKALAEVSRNGKNLKPEEAKVEALKKLKAEAVPGFYSMSDDFDGFDAEPADGSQWG